MIVNRMGVLLLGCAFLVRLLFNAYVTGIDNPGLELFPDGKDYDALGLSLAKGTGYAIHGTPNLVRPPGYPFFLAALYTVFGHSYAAVKVSQSVLGALTCLMVLLIGQRLFTTRVGVIAAAIAAVYPFLVLYTGFLLSEILFVFLSTVFLYVLVRLREHYAGRWVPLGGLILGMMNLIRPVTLLLPAFLFFWAWIEFGTKKQAAVIAGMMTIWMMVPIVPWMVRNYLVTQSFILVDDHKWVTLYAANNSKILQDPEKIGGWVEPGYLADYRSEYLTFMRRTLVHEPLEFLRLEFYKLLRFWSVLPTSSKATTRDAIVSLFSYGVLLPFFVVGSVLALKLPQRPWFLYVWILYFCLMTLIVYGSTRFRAPVEPALILFGAFSLEWCWARFFGGRNAPEAQPPAASHRVCVR